MKTLIVLLVILLIIGPLRKPLLSLLSAWWMIILPLALGSIIGCVAMRRFMPYAPRWLLIAGPLFGAFMFGTAIVELFHMMKK